MDELISKSQKKRDADQLQKLGAEFTALSPHLLDKLPLTPELRQAIDAAKKMTSHGAQRRQIQYIGKLMRNADLQEVCGVYEQIKEEAQGKTVNFHELEHWRDRLMHEGKEVITAFKDLYPHTDTQQLRHLIKKATAEHHTGTPAGAMKALFRFLRTCS